MKNKNDIDSVMKDVNKMKQYQDRMKNKRRIRNRKWNDDGLVRIVFFGFGC